MVELTKMANKSLANYRVPTQPFRQLIQNFALAKKISLEECSINCGLGEDTLRRAVFVRDSCSFDTMDRILTHTVGALVWHTDFAEIYWQGDVPPDPAKPLRCKNPSCDDWLEVNLVGGWGKGRLQEYCSKQCRHLAYKHRHRDKVRKRDAARMKAKYQSDAAFREEKVAYCREYYQKTAEHQRERARLNRLKRKGEEAA